MFTLNDTQRAALAAARAWHEEGERRFESWSRREAHQAAADAFGRTLAESGLGAGRGLDDAARLRLLRFAGELAPNKNLSRRLFSADRADFDRRLRVLLYGGESLEVRLRTFLAARGTGTLTASQLLCAFAPDTYPLITRPALRRLRLTAAQRRSALAEAADRYGFVRPAETPPSPAQQILAQFVAYEAVRAALGVAAYPDVDGALRAEGAVLPIISVGAVHETQTAYAATPSPALTETALLAALEEFAAGQGFVFPPHLLRSYYIALKTKPFVLLSGVSGTGKTKLAELFAEALTGRHPAQFRLIPVRPDWADSTALFGYHNVLANRYISTPFLDMARAAALPENRSKAFFLCLDEMNLARVEHYLADYLSALESRAHRVPLHPDLPDLILPPNLFVTGTVNVDETTHAFSRKVLDRANTLDFDTAPVFLSGLGGAAKGIVRLEDDLSISTTQRQTLFLHARIAGAGRARERLSRIDAGYPERALSLLQAMNDLLYPHRLHFAYRVRDEALIFLANSFDSETGHGLLLPDVEDNFRIALDLQIKQKALPRLSGVPELLGPLLAQLQSWAEAANLPLTAAKLMRMRTHGAATGYIQFYE